MGAAQQERKVIMEAESTPNPLAKDPSKPLKLIKFGAKWCSFCVAMDRSKILEKIAEAHPEIELILIDVDKHEELADEYEVQSMPSIFFEDKDGFILAEHAGGMNFDEVEKLYAKAKAKVK